jgi:hypothetical protein
LSKYPDIEVEIFEGAEKLGEIGAGIGLFPRRPPYSTFVMSMTMNSRNLGDHKEAWLGETAAPVYGSQTHRWSG